MITEYPGGILIESAPLESTGGKVWDASLKYFDVLSSIISRLNPEASVRVLELGSGCGWLGLRLAQTYKDIEVVMSEQEEFGALDWLKHNISLNPKIAVHAIPLNWGQIPSEVVSQPWDLIIGCELVYSYKGAELLASAIDELLSHPGAVCYYGHSLNRFESVDAHFLSELRRRDFVIDVEHGELVEPGEYLELFPEMQLVVFRISRII